MKIQWDAVTSITSTQNLHLAMKGGQTLVGSVTTTDTHLTIATKSSGDVTAPLSDVTTIRNDAEEAVYEKTVLHPASPIFGAALSTPDSASRAAIPILSITLSPARLRAFLRAIKFPCTPPRSIPIIPPPARKRSPRTIFREASAAISTSAAACFAFAMADFEYDQFQNLNLRSVFGGGAGFHVINRKNTTFDVNAGGAYENENFSTPLTRTSGEVIVGETFATKIGPRVTLSEAFSVYPDITHSGQYRFTLTPPPPPN